MTPVNPAVVCTAFGGPEVLAVTTRPMPSAGPHEVVVRVAAATVNPTDVLLRTGLQAAPHSPVTPGMEFAGHVAEVGAGVDHVEAGQPVMGVVNPHRPEGGAQAAYVAVPAASVVAVPDRVGLAEAATIPMNGLTALMVVEELGSAGAVLVTGGAGAVGGYTTPLAKRAGFVVLTDGKPADEPLLRELGSDAVVPRGSGMAQGVRALHPSGVDALVDTARLGEEAAALVRDGGTVVGLRSGDPRSSSRLMHRVVMVGNRLTDTRSLEVLAGHLTDGVLRPRVAVEVPMTHAAEAHRLLERGGLRGRVVLRFDGVTDER